MDIYAGRPIIYRPDVKLDWCDRQTMDATFVKKIEPDHIVIRTSESERPICVDRRQVLLGRKLYK